MFFGILFAYIIGMKKSIITIILAIAGVLVSANAHALRLGDLEVHPYLWLTERYTDNVFNTNTNTDSDFSTIITPGVRLILPMVQKRYHLDLQAQADFTIYNKFSSQNSTSYMAMGKFDGKLPSGITLNIYDVFRRGFDQPGVNLTTEIEYFYENGISASLEYDLSNRFTLRADYTNHFLTYENDQLNYRNEGDNTIATYFFYKIMPKTSVFAEYQYVKFNYDVSPQDNNSENYIYGGITWDVTAKSTGRIQAGYETKRYDNPSLGKYNNFAFDVSIDHNFDPKNSLKLLASSRTHETNMQGTLFYTTTGFLLQYYHRITGKISARGDVGYGQDKYHGGIPRTDNTWRAAVWLFYQIKRWLRIELGYDYTNRNSNIDEFSYKNNTFYIRLNATP